MAKKSPGQSPGSQGKVKKSAARAAKSATPAKPARPAVRRGAQPGRAGANAAAPEGRGKTKKAAAIPAPARAKAARPTAKGVARPSARKSEPPRAVARGRVVSRRPVKSASRPATDEAAGPQRPPALSEEDEIRSAKYLPRDLPPRLFEEERFLFPESYGQDRVRLLVKDPDWLFSHWDVSPEALAAVKETIGERAMSLARLTLRIADPVNGGMSDILLPPGARSWYVRTDRKPRSYKAELGLTLASGEFRRLAESNTVVTPRVGPSSSRAGRRVRYGRTGEPLPPLAGEAGEPAEDASASGPWQAPSIDAAAPSEESQPPESAEAGPGGASDVFRRGGASDVFRR